MAKQAIVSDTYTDANTKSKGWLNIIIMVVVIIAIVMIVKSIYNASKAGGLAIGEQMGKTIIELQTGIAPARQSVCEDVADTIFKTGYTVYPFIGSVFNVNDEIFINQINRLLTTQEAALSNAMFKQKTGQNYSWLINDFTFSGSARINPEILKVIK